VLCAIESTQTQEPGGTFHIAERRKERHNDSILTGCYERIIDLMLKTTGLGGADLIADRHNESEVAVCLRWVIDAKRAIGPSGTERIAIEHNGSEVAGCFRWVIVATTTIGSGWTDVDPRS
jgi:hypothetical protein